MEDKIILNVSNINKKSKLLLSVIIFLLFQTQDQLLLEKIPKLPHRSAGNIDSNKKAKSILFDCFVKIIMISKIKATTPDINPTIINPGIE